MDTIINNEEYDIYFQDYSNNDNMELFNYYLSFNKESNLNVSFGENNIYYSSNNNNSNEYEIFFNDNNDNDEENENENEDDYDYMKYNKINFENFIKKLNKKKKGKKIKNFKYELKIINYFKNKNEKLYGYINASERKQRKMMKSLYEKKQRLYKLLLKKKIEKRIHLNIKKKNFDFLHLFFNQVHINNVKIEKLPCTYLGRKRF